MLKLSSIFLDYIPSFPIISAFCWPLISISKLYHHYLRMDAFFAIFDSVDLMSTILSMSFHFSGESQIQSPHTAFFPVKSQVLTIKIAHFFPLKPPLFMVKPPHVPLILPFYHNSVLIQKNPSEISMKLGEVSWKSLCFSMVFPPPWHGRFGIRGSRFGAQGRRGAQRRRMAQWSHSGERIYGL